MADTTIYTLSKDDVGVLRRLASESRNRRASSDGGSRDIEDGYQTPEVYVAKTPVDGIPGLIEGTESEPGYAECDIYTVVLSDPGNVPQLKPVGELTQRVYNLSVEPPGTGTGSGSVPAAIAGDTWILTIRDKFGQWFVAASGGGSGSNAALVTITSATVTASKQPGTVVKGGSGTCKVQNYYTGQPALTNGKTYYAILDGTDGGDPLYWVALEACA